LSAATIYKKVSPSVFELSLLDSAGNETGFASAVVIGKDTVITNKHVAAMAEDIAVKTRSGKLKKATLAYCHPSEDLVGLKVPDLDAPIVSRRKSKSLEVGEPVFAIGSPEALERSLSTGIVSGLRWVGDVCHIQSSALTLNGSSGGGLFDAKGNLIGISTITIEGAFDLALSADLISDLLEHPVPDSVHLSDAKYRASLAYSTAREYYKFGSTQPAAIANALLNVEQRYAEVAAKLDPSDSKILDGLAGFYALQGDVKAAMLCLQRAQRINPSSPATYFDMVWLFGKLGRRDAAVAAYRRLLTLDPRLAQKAKVLLKENNIDPDKASPPPKRAQSDNRTKTTVDTKLQETAQIFLGYINRTVKRNWKPVESAKPYDVKLVFKINPEGQVSDLRVTSTGPATASESAKLALMSSAPFMAVPKELIGQRKFVEVGMTLDSRK
ncbi:MAG: serine protease, partial [Cyanobacteria bacterium]|nr:serine protease [Cyanobacteriota bacterium]